MTDKLCDGGFMTVGLNKPEHVLTFRLTYAGSVEVDLCAEHYADHKVTLPPPAKLW